MARKSTDVEPLDPMDEGPELDPLRSLPGLPRPHKTKVWECRVCGATLNVVDKGDGRCYNCGRDFFGRPGDVPQGRERPRRPQVRSDGESRGA